VNIPPAIPALSPIAPTAPRPRLSSDDRRRQLLGHAIALFSRHGFSGTRTKDIAAACGVSEAILFRHFATKEDLYHAILDTHEAAADVSTRVRGGKRALVTNPEHIAVMLDYAADASQAPIVIGKATDDGALSLTNSALLERIPVFRCRALARHLFQHGELHVAIPPDCYRAVAIVYRIVDELEHLEERPNVPIEIDDVVFDS